METIKVMCGCLMVFFFVFLFVETVFFVCFMSDADYMKVSAQIRADYGIVWNPRRLGALIYHYRWPNIDEYWTESEMFFSGIPGILAQFWVKDAQYYENKKERRKERVRNYLKGKNSP